MENNNALILQIEQKLNTFTKSEEKVAKFILENPNVVINSTITELAELSECSEGTVVRFCRSLGYKGYQKFKISFVQNVVDPYKHLNPAFEKEDSIENIIDKIFKNVGMALNQTRVMLDVESFEKAVEAISDCKCLEIYGSGGSGIVAKDVQHKLMKNGIKCNVYEDMDLQLMSASLLRQGSVAMGISHSGTNEGTIECLRLARDAGATTIVLASQGKSPIIKYGDIVLENATMETIFKSESVSGRIAQLVIMDALIAAVSFRKYDISYEAIQKTRDATSLRKV
jgi:DNA-binding MurR/RpiR family transcriptional regulator